MAYITINNEALISSDLTNIDGWTVGIENAWGASLVPPDNHGVFGFFSFTSTGNTFYQTGVFTDYGSGTLHKIKVDCTLVASNGTVDVYMGGTYAGQITSTGIHYFTASASTGTTLTFDVTRGLVVLDYVRLADMDIVSNPQAVVPVYNQNWFTINSINSAQQNFEYVFDIYTGSTTGNTAITSLHIQQAPDNTGNVYFSPFRVLESYLSFDRNIQNITSGRTSFNHIMYYTLGIGEAYGSSLTGQTIYSGLTTFSGLTFNGVISYEDYPSWLYTTYALSGATSKFLTHQPINAVKVKDSTDRGTLSYLKTTSGSTNIKLIVTHDDGTTYTNTFTNYSSTGSTPNRFISHIPSGPWNLNNLTSGWFTAVTGSVITVCTDTKYTLQILSGTTPISEVMTYWIDKKYSKYDLNRLQFKNSLGGYDYMNFTLTNRQNLKVDRKSFQKPLAHNYVVGDRGATVFIMDANYDYSINTDWLTDAESVWFKELMWSSEVNLIDSAGISYPIVLDTDSLEILKTINKKMISYTIKYKPANKINTVRQ